MITVQELIIQTLDKLVDSLDTRSLIKQLITARLSAQDFDILDIIKDSEDYKDICALQDVLNRHDRISSLSSIINMYNEHLLDPRFKEHFNSHRIVKVTGSIIPCIRALREVFDDLGLKEAKDAVVAIRDDRYLSVNLDDPAVFALSNAGFTIVEEPD